MKRDKKRAEPTGHVGIATSNDEVGQVKEASHELDRPGHEFPEHLGLKPGVRKRLLRLDEVCEMLSFSRSMVYRLVCTGALPSVKVGRSRRFRIEAVDDYLESLGDGFNG